MQAVEGRAGLALEAGGRVSDLFDGYPVYPVRTPAENISAFFVPVLVLRSGVFPLPRPIAVLLLHLVMYRMRLLS